MELDEFVYRMGKHANKLETRSTQLGHKADSKLPSLVQVTTLNTLLTLFTCYFVWTFLTTKYVYVF